MTKITLDLADFKALASDTRLNILKALDGKKSSLKDISSATNLHEMTIHEHISKLVEAGFVNKHEREGHKWVYYDLSWKGSCLLHPENTKVVILFSTTFLSLAGGLLGLVYVAQKIFAPIEPPNTYGNITAFNIFDNHLLLYFTLGCLFLFVGLMSVSIRKWKHNKTQKL